MIIAVDACYSRNSVRAAGVLFQNWESATDSEQVVADLDFFEDYIPGKFYLRELPCLVSVLEKVKTNLNTIVIDGYVTLGGNKEPGLGMMLWEYFERTIPVIGVAKSKFEGTPDNTILYRGQSARPLYITSAGVDIIYAKTSIANMHGKHRIPDLLKKTDLLSKSAA